MFEQPEAKVDGRQFKPAGHVPLIALAKAGHSADAEPHKLPDVVGNIDDGAPYQAHR